MCDRVCVCLCVFASLEWTAARSGAHTAAKTMLEDMLTIRAETKQQTKAAITYYKMLKCRMKKLPEPH